MSFKATASKFFWETEEEVMRPTLVASPKTSICMRTPVKFSDVREYADRLMAGEALLISYDELSAEECTKMVDYLAGVSYIVGAAVTMVTAEIVLYTPKQMGVENLGCKLK